MKRRQKAVATGKGAGARKVLSYTMLVLVALLACELVTRTFFAFLVGPRVLAYGTSLYREATSLPSKVMVKVGYTPPTPDEPVGRYSKFAPNELKFDRDEHDERFSPAINSRGFRGREISTTKEPGVIRVVALGGSSTFGYHNRDDETYSWYLEEALNKEAGDSRYQVINLGIPHIDSGQIVSLFHEEALPLVPDIVTLYAGWNDSGGVRKVARLTEERSPVFLFLRSRSLLFSFADSLLFFRSQRFHQEHYTALREGKERDFLANVENLREACRERGILFVAATQQARSMLLDREDLPGVTYGEETAQVRTELEARGVPRRALVFLIHDQMMRALEDWAVEQGVPLVDARAALDHDRDTLLTYVHLSPRGNRIVADALAEKILRLTSSGAADVDRERDPEL